MQEEQTKNENNEASAESEENTQNIKDFGMTDIQNSRGKIHCLSIVGQVEGHMLLPAQNKTTKYEHVIPLVVSVEQDERIDGLLVVLNTIGGDVEAGLAIAEMIAGMTKPTVSLVLGGGHSIGIPLAVSADYSFVAETGTMTMHPIRTSGTLITADSTFEYMRQTQERVVDFIAAHSHASKEDIEQKMNQTGNMSNDVGTVLFGEDAVKMGLIDEIGGLRHALEKLRTLTGEMENNIFYVK